MSEIRTRFAPSPTGHLHVGGARTALFNWLLARSQGGKFILRIEDTDMERSKDEYTEVILEALSWLGLDWDEGPFYQRERKDLHMEYIRKLLDAGRAYYCHCTPEELDERREKAMAEGGKPKYDGRCRDKNLGPAPGAVIRFRGPLSGETGWNDEIKGPVSFDNKELDDLIILRSDGMPTYNLAVVVDDITMNLTHIIRGDDHVNNTPRQILLYEALGVPCPKFGHMPLTLGQDKKRLSKRHGATSLQAFREMGYLPEALLNYLVRLGWSYGDQEIFSKEELFEKFSLDNVGRSAGVFDYEKLLWLNAHYMKESTPERLLDLVGPYLQEMKLDAPDKAFLARAVETLQPRARTLPELAEGLVFYLVEDVEYEEKAAKKFLKPALLPIMEEMLEKLKGFDTFKEDEIETLFREVAQNHEVGLGKIAQPVRVALTGKTASPGLFEIMDILGKEKVMRRMQKARDYMDQGA